VEKQNRYAVLKAPLIVALKDSLSTINLY